MSKPRKPEDFSLSQQENAALAALGLASSAQAADAPAPLAAYFQESAAILGQAVEPVAPPPSLKSRLMSRIADYETLRPLTEIRSYDGTWRNTGVPGVDMKMLFKDPVSQRLTLLIRMEPGAQYPAHVHHDVEQCMVLSGDVRWRDIVLESGDFVVMDKDSHHPEIGTAGGNVLLFVTGHTEFSAPHR